jgi:hypothetical protein
MLSRISRDKNIVMQSKEYTMIMNKTKRHLLQYLAILICCVWVYGCGPTDSTLVRFQRVPIPTYELSEYEALLASDDPDIQSNAIANLIPHAVAYARILASDEPQDDADALRATNEVDTYAQAQYVFTTIREALQSDDENIKSASLMFLAEFAPFYAEKKSLFTTVSQIKSRDTRTQYEQLNTLLALIESDTEVNRTMITQFLNSRTWRIRSMTYRLLSRIPCADLHPQILSAYRNATHEHDKLVILHAFAFQYGTDVLELFKAELVEGKSSQIHRLIAEMLPIYSNAKAVGQWIAAEYHALHDDIVVRIFDEYADEFSTSHGVHFFEGLLMTTSPDLMPLLEQSAIIESLYQAIGEEPSRSNLIRLRASIHQNPSLKHAWDTYARERVQVEEALKAEEALRQTILPHYTKLLNAFLEDTRQLLADFGMETDEIENTTEDMRELLQLFQGMPEE